MTQYRKITGQFQNGNLYSALVAEDDYAEYLQTASNSTSDGSPLDMSTIVMEIINIEEQE